MVLADVAKTVIRRVRLRGSERICFGGSRRNQCVPSRGTYVDPFQGGRNVLRSVPEGWDEPPRRPPCTVIPWTPTARPPHLTSPPPALSNPDPGSETEVDAPTDAGRSPSRASWDGAPGGPKRGYWNPHNRRHLGRSVPPPWDGAPDACSTPSWKDHLYRRL